MSDKDIRFIFSGQDKASATFDKVGGKALGLAKKIRGAGRDISKLAADVYAGTTALLKYAAGWDKLEASMASSGDQLTESASRLSKAIGDRFEKDRDRIGTIIDPVEQEAAFNELLASAEKNLDKVTAKYIEAQTAVENVQGGWIDMVSSNHAEATKIEREGAQERANAAKQTMDAYQQQVDELRKLTSEETKLQKEREAAFKKHVEGDAYVKQLQLQVDALKMSKAALDDREASMKAANAEQLNAARALIAERDAILAANEAREKATETVKSWMEATKKAYADATQAQQDARKAAWEDKKAEKQQREDLYKSSIEDITRERIAFEQGEEAARKYELGLQGLDAARAAEIAGLEEKMRQDQKAREEAEKEPEAKISKAIGALTARDGRLLTGRGVTMDYAKTTADESKKSSKLLTKVADGIRDLIEAVKNNTPAEIEGV